MICSHEHLHRHNFVLLTLSIHILAPTHIYTYPFSSPVYPIPVMLRTSWLKLANGVGVRIVGLYLISASETFVGASTAPMCVDIRKGWYATSILLFIL